MTQQKTILFAATALVFFGLACGEKREKSAPATTTPASSPQPESEPPPVPAPEVTDNLPPIAAPATYFPDAKGERIVESFRVAPVPEGSVVLIVIDALNARHLGVYGSRRETSPNIDDLARRSILFTNHVSNSSWTRPSYATIITGQPKSVHNTELNAKDLPGKLVTIAERFRAAGYRTAGFIGNPLVGEIWGFAQGYERFVDTRSLDKVFPPDEWLVDRGIKWMERNKEEPFFASFFLTAPHVPYDPPAEPRKFLRSVERGEINRYPFREYKTPLPDGEHARIAAAYDDEIAYADQQVGRILDFLKHSGLAKKTIVAITADHGEAMGDHGCYGHSYHMWESVVRVPMVLSTPTLPRGGVLEDRPFTHLDIAPTLLEAVGVKQEAPTLPGKSILATLRSPNTGRQRDVYTQYNAYGIRRQALRREGLKLIRYHAVRERVFNSINRMNPKIPRADPRELPTLVSQLAGERFELFNLKTDPEEAHNLYSNSESRESAAPLIGELLSNCHPETKRGDLSPELIEALRNAGYMVPAESETRE